MIVFPLGLFATAVIFDIIYLLNDRTGFSTAAGYMMGAGLLGGIIAGAFGLIDWSAIRPGTRAKRVGTLHAVGNLVVLLLFGASWLIRLANDWVPNPAALILSVAGIALAGVTGWLGGELVERLGVGVDDQAGPNAPSSIGTPALVPHRVRKPR
jgi:uncharacterized membrane protein